jgi:hypothetical protein
MRSLRFLRVVLLAAALAISSVALASGTVFAYGHADQPLAQLEISGNCDNPDFAFCRDVVGIGGIWLWIEIDADGTADVAGSACAHNVGGPRGGAFAIRGEFDWISASIPPSPQLLVTDPTNTYYVLQGLDLFPIPVTQGHYSFQPVPGVSLQVQVAP